MARTQARPTTSQRSLVALGLTTLLFGAAAATGACAAGTNKSTSSAATSGSGFDFASAGAGGGNLIDSACAKSTDEAKNVPLDIYIMFDRSGSMAGPKWSKSTAALQGFFMSPKNAGIGVALRFFPDSGTSSPGCDGTKCNASACAKPQVPLGYLTELSAPTDTHEQALFDAFVGLDPAGGTPLSIALEGAVSWAKDTLSANPGHKAVIVLVTDGEPTDCNTKGSFLVETAKSAFKTAGVVTFALGLEGASKSLLDQIAAAGGTESGIIIGTDNAEEELLAALDGIRDKQIACDYAIPASNSGDPVDLTQVNVIYFPGSGSSKQTFGQVSDATACGDKVAWHYDDPSNPQKIKFCPAACKLVQPDTKAAVQIVLGCNTIPA
ncbi:MAG: VWA domain-containing protein [Deltaproteobacteria bacterium]|nr:VWA domain-containing protein [Deltaproteobacteria bacterium]